MAPAYFDISGAARRARRYFSFIGSIAFLRFCRRSGTSPVQLTAIHAIMRLSRNFPLSLHLPAFITGRTRTPTTGHKLRYTPLARLTVSPKARAGCCGLSSCAMLLHETAAWHRPCIYAISQKSFFIDAISPANAHFMLADEFYAMASQTYRELTLILLPSVFASFYARLSIISGCAHAPFAAYSVDAGHEMPRG